MCVQIADWARYNPPQGDICGGLEPRIPPLPRIGEGLVEMSKSELPRRHNHSWRQACAKQELPSS